jgi:hypothetical protein
VTWPEALVGTALILAAVLFFGFFTDSIKINIGNK